MDRIINILFQDNELIDEDENLQENRRRPRSIRPRINYLNIFDAVDFKKRFVISRHNFMMLLERIQAEIQHNTDRNNAIPPAIQLMVALRFYATGSFLKTIGDFCAISEVSAHDIIHRVSPAIAALRDEFIKLPISPEEIRVSQREFFETAKFIRVIGCIDCTHVRIQSYGGKDSELYRNRKGYFSLNIQVVINAKLEIIDIVARWPGSAHDSTIFNHSRIKSLFEANRFGDALLLGDSGYPNLPYLMTPLLNPTKPAEHLYNEAQIRTRSRIERCFGIWKRRFAVLSIGSRFHTVQKMLPIVIATAILHNIAQQKNEPNVINPEIYDNVIAEVQNVRVDNMNIRDERQHLLSEYFERLL
ncbi:PREDICTED: putative nuclease HARBI1 [Trachymyrmex cornetzi]|uniref:putative nuclease HARBI1 n=1 Tax=Trachymyrmex cornetzi TaxID=471704 RepID=UPI00084F663C|nr:PREDICTED: putative nuclease HARBI1 [Trachymyrmex cornetzi]